MIWNDEKEIAYDCFLYRKVVSQPKDIAPTTVFERWIYDADSVLDAIAEFEKNGKIDKETLAVDKNGRPLLENTSSLGRWWTLKNGETYQEYIMGFVSLNQ